MEANTSRRESGYQEASSWHRSGKMSYSALSQFVPTVPVILVLRKDEGTQVWTERHLPANQLPKNWHPASLMVSDALTLGLAGVEGNQLPGFPPAGP